VLWFTGEAKHDEDGNDYDDEDDDDDYEDDNNDDDNGYDYDYDDVDDNDDEYAEYYDGEEEKPEKKVTFVFPASIQLISLPHSFLYPKKLKRVLFIFFQLYSPVIPISILPFPLLHFTLLEFFPYYWLITRGDGTEKEKKGIIFVLEASMEV